MILQTNLCVAHLALIKVFFEANNMASVNVSDALSIIRGQSHKIIQLSWDDYDIDEKLTLMSLRHSGVQNMLDHYLLKCGVPWNELEPKTYYRQLQKEKEDAQIEEYMEHLKNLKV